MRDSALALAWYSGEWGRVHLGLLRQPERVLTRYDLAGAEYQQFRAMLLEYIDLITSDVSRHAPAISLSASDRGRNGRASRWAVRSCSSVERDVPDDLVGHQMTVAVTPLTGPFNGRVLRDSDHPSFADLRRHPLGCPVRLYPATA
jgi:hypothetical protein